MKKLIFSLTGIILLCFLSSYSISENKVVVTVAVNHWPPWKIIDNNQPKGIDIAILEEIEKRSKIDFELTQCPWKRCIQLVKDGEVDMITSFNFTAERESFVSYLHPPYYSDSIIFFALQESNILVDEYNDLYGNRIGVIKGASYFARFDNDLKLDKESVSSHAQAFKMLQNKRIDLFAIYEIPGDYIAQTMNMDSMIQKVDYRKNRAGLNYFALSKKSEISNKIQNDIKMFLYELEEEGKLEEIIRNYH